MTRTAFDDELALMISARVREARLLRDITQTELARLVGGSVDSVHICRIESCRTRPNVGLIVRIAKSLRVTTDYLLGLEEFPE